jgi:hypothetical protein
MPALQAMEKHARTLRPRCANRPPDLSLRAQPRYRAEPHWARAIVTMEGRLVIERIEPRSRGLKSSAVKTRQVGWCMFEVERA